MRKILKLTFLSFISWGIKMSTKYCVTKSDLNVSLDTICPLISLKVNVSFLGEWLSFIEEEKIYPSVHSFMSITALRKHCKVEGQKTIFSL